MLKSLPTNPPLVSVVVPNFNYARYLRGRIDSILQQTFSNYEIILLDDASTDESVSVLEHYRNSPQVSQICINEKNTGSPFAQWLKGIQLSKGKYVWIAEADDLAEPTFLETCVELLESFKDSAFCYVGSKTIDETGEVSNKDVNHWGRRQKKEYACFDGKKFAEHNLYWKNYVMNASGVVFRREYALNLIHSPFQSMRYCGDWFFWFEMAMQGGVVEVYKNLNYFRMHASKVTQKSQKTGEGVIEDMQVLSLIEAQLPNISNYKKRLRRGLLYRKIKRGKHSEQREKELFAKMEDILNAHPSDYKLERCNQIFRLFLPMLITHKRDRL
ncbi:MAG: glycosyltransferase family 2 protein [Bacteroidaceae bacterium]|nr:glycosyltransferase family 2 protein [Bacteroidaceae bacterium]